MIAARAQAVPPLAPATGIAPRRRTLVQKLAVCAVGCAVALVCVEGAARVAWKWQYNRVLSGQLSGFQLLDRDRAITLLKPGVSFTSQEFLDMLRRGGKSFGASLLEEHLKARAIPAASVIFHVNSHGLVGPECAAKPLAGVTRILAIGDSVTFGPYVAEDAYPRVVEREMNRLSGLDRGRFEVLNAGVQGYNLESVLKRLDEFLAFEPRIVTVLIGWNRTILRADPAKNDDLYERFALYRFFYHSVLDRKSAASQAPGSPANYYSADDPIIPKLRQITFEKDLRSWNELIERTHRRLPASKLVILTLPGLFAYGNLPDERTRKMAFPLAFSNNLYGWDVLTDIYNRKLTALALRTNSELIDVAEWSRTGLVPRSAFFADSVHLTTEGYELMGKYIASELFRRYGARAGDTTGSDPVEEGKDFRHGG